MGGGLTVVVNSGGLDGSGFNYGGDAGGGDGAHDEMRSVEASLRVESA
jgi:hypothetical protein